MHGTLVALLVSHLAVLQTHAFQEGSDFIYARLCIRARLASKEDGNGRVSGNEECERAGGGGAGLGRRDGAIERVS